MSDDNSRRAAVLAVIREGIAPTIGDDGIPHCSDDCPEYDGKRCRVIGFRPYGTCEPAMDDMGAFIERAAKALGVGT